MQVNLRSPISNQVLSSTSAIDPGKRIRGLQFNVSGQTSARGAGLKSAPDHFSNDGTFAKVTPPPAM